MKSRFNVTYCARKHFGLISQLRNQNLIQRLKTQIHDGIGVSIGSLRNHDGDGNKNFTNLHI